MLTISWFLVGVTVTSIAFWAASSRLKLTLGSIALAGFWWFTPTTRDYLPIPFLSPIEALLYVLLLYVLFFEDAPLKRYISLSGPPMKLTVVGFAFLFVFGLTTLLVGSRDIAYGSYYLRNASILPLAIILIGGFGLHERRQLLFVMDVFVAGTAVFCLVLLTNYLMRTYDPESLINTNFGARLGGHPTFPFRFRVLYDPVSLGVALSTLFPFLASWSIHSFGQVRGKLGSFVLLLVLGVVFATGTRGAWIALVASAVFVFFLYGNKKSKILLLGFFSVVVILFIESDLMSVNPILAERVVSLQDVSSQGNLEYRIELINKAWDILLANPLGLGFGRFHRPIMNEHNMYMFIAMGTGLVGLIVFCIILLSLFQSLRKGYSISDSTTKALCAGGLGSLVALVINGLGDASIMEAYQTQVIFLVIAITHAGVLIASKEVSSQPVIAEGLIGKSK